MPQGARIELKVTRITADGTPLFTATCCGVEVETRVSDLTDAEVHLLLARFTTSVRNQLNKIAKNRRSLE